MKDIDIVLSAVLILLISSILFNLNMTGMTTRNTASIEISPKIVKQMETIKITINPGKDGVLKRFVSIYKGDTRKYTFNEFCQEKTMSTNRCYETETIFFRIPDNWDAGTYKIRVNTGYGEKNIKNPADWEMKYVESSFKIVNYQDRGDR